MVDWWAVERGSATRLPVLSEAQRHHVAHAFQRAQLLHDVGRDGIVDRDQRHRFAQHLGRPDRVRAVGAANGRNPLPVVVPRQRVIGADGRLTGYRGGLERKRALLELEGAVTARQLALC